MFYLSEERAELDTAFVIYKSVGKESATITIHEDAGAQVNVLAVAHRSEAFQGFVNAFLDTQVEAAGIELVHFSLAAADATCGEKRGHGIVDGFLYGRERWMSTVGTAEGIAGLAVKFFLDDFQIVFGHDDIGIQDDEIVAMAAFGTIVARWTGTRVGFEVIIQIQSVFVFFADQVAFFLRAVLHHHDLEILERLRTKALQQFIDFLRPIIYGYND